MKISREIRPNLNDYYEKGVTQTLVIKEHYQRLVKAIENMTWIDDEKGPYKKIPTWTQNILSAIPEKRFQQEKDIGKQALNNCPEELKQALKSMLSDPRIVGDLTVIYDIRLDFVDVWDGVEDMGWHWDGPCQSEMISLIYFNGPNLGLDYGGGIEAGIRDLPMGKHWLNDFSDIKSVAVYPPSARTQLWINNSNPRFGHRPHPLKNKEAPRMTMTFGMSLIPKQ